MKIINIFPDLILTKCVKVIHLQAREIENLVVCTPAHNCINFTHFHKILGWLVCHPYAPGVAPQPPQRKNIKNGDNTLNTAIVRHLFACFRRPPKNPVPLLLSILYIYYNSINIYYIIRITVRIPYGNSSLFPGNIFFEVDKTSKAHYNSIMKKENTIRKQCKNQLIQRMREVQEAHYGGMKSIAMIPFFQSKWACKADTVKSVIKKVLDAIAAEIPQGVENKRVSLWMSAEKVFDAAFLASDFRACIEAVKVMAALYSLLGGDIKVNGQIEVKGTATLGQMHESLRALESVIEKRN